MHSANEKDVAYLYDGSLEGLLSAIFYAFENKVTPSDVVREWEYVPRLAQDQVIIATDISKAKRVKDMLCRRCGYEAYRCVTKVSLSGDLEAGTYAYRYVCHLVDRIRSSDCTSCKRHKSCPRKGASNRSRCYTFKRFAAMGDITDPLVSPIFSIARSVDAECEKIRQFARFEHLSSESFDLWFSRINPKHSVVPLVMGHFVERFNVQPFIIFDENRDLAGVYNGNGWFMTSVTEESISKNLESLSAEERLMQYAWKTFYDTLSIDSRYNPELRRNFMPKRFWKNLTELKEMPRTSIDNTRR